MTGECTPCLSWSCSCLCACTNVCMDLKRAAIMRTCSSALVCPISVGGHVREFQERQVTQRAPCCVSIPPRQVRQGEEQSKAGT